MDNRDATSGPVNPPRRLLVAVDLCAASQQALAFAAGLVTPGAQVHIVSVAENPRTLLPTGALSAAVLDAVRAELLRDATAAVAHARASLEARGIAADTEVIDTDGHGGNVVHALLHAARAWHPELMIVGARQHRGWLARWVEGTVSEPLARLAPCPILIVPAEATPTSPHVPRRILFAVDGSSQARNALAFGLTLASAEADLRAIYVVDHAVRFTDVVPIDALRDAFIEEGEAALGNAAPMLAKVSAHATTTLIETAQANDDIAQAILLEAEKWHAELIVMGTHGRRGVARWLLGSVADRVAHATSIPLLLVNSQA